MDEALAFAFAAEARVLERHEHGDREAIVRLHHVDVFALDAGHAERALGSDADRVVEQIWRVGDALVREVLAEARDEHRAMPRTPRAFGGCYEQRAATEARHHDLEQLQRIGNAARLHHVVQRDRLAVEDRVGVELRVVALVDRNLRERLLAQAVTRHVALSDHRVARSRRDQPLRNLERALRRAPGVAPQVDWERHLPALRSVRPRRHHARAQHEHRLARADFDRSGRAP